MSEEKCRKCWNGEYPIFIEVPEADKPSMNEATCDFQEHKFIEEEYQLIRLCKECRLDPRALTYYEALPVYAWEGVNVSADELEYEGDLDEEVKQLIDEFQQKLRDIKRPIVYYPNSPIKVPVSQLEEWYVKSKGI